MDNYNIVNVLENGLLDSDDNIVGRKGGLLSGGGIVVNYDSRDHLFTPREGVLAKMVLFANEKILGIGRSMVLHLWIRPANYARYQSKSKPQN